MVATLPRLGTEAALGDGGGPLRSRRNRLLERCRRSSKPSSRSVKLELRPARPPTVIQLGAPRRRQLPPQPLRCGLPMDAPGKRKKTNHRVRKADAPERERRPVKPVVAPRVESRDSESESELHALLARRVRDARARRFMTRKALAQQSGISLAYLARVENGTGNISLSLLQRLALALNLPIETFLSAEKEPNADFAMIVEFLKRQSPERLARIRRQLFGSHDHAERVALVGIRGVGKSTLGPLLAERLGVPFVELNREIEKEAGLAVSEIFTVYGQQGYRVMERRCLERVTAQSPKVVLATGGGIVAEPATYEILLSSFFTIWLKATPESMFERVLAQHDARIANAELRNEALENIERTLEARRHLYELAPASFDTTGRTIDQIVTALLSLLSTSSRS
jgi:XRE family transcriptional regulator, aerobic/anaerobic benzoate catabolism transcriptional regulator